MKRFTSGSVSAVLLAIPLVWACSSAKGQSRNNSEDGTAELRSLQKELIATLSQKVEVLTTQYHTGGTDYDQVYIVQLELCDAKLDATEKPDERIALLEEQLRIAEAAQKITEERKNSARATEANVLSAKSLCLKIKIRLVQERGKQKANHGDGTFEKVTDHPMIETIRIEGGKVELNGQSIKIEGGKVEINHRQR